MNNLLENELYKSLYHTSILAIIIFLIAIASYFFLNLGLKITNDKAKLKNRITYISCIMFVLFCAKIWVQGFTQIFYGLSLVSAGLVVTNKESIMNLVGWGIISWRGLFSEGDFIEIAGVSGVVKELGVFYFKILESSSLKPTRTTGKFLKIPNGTVITNIVKRVSLERHYVEHQICFSTSIKTDIVKLKNRLLDIIDKSVPSIELTNIKNKSKKDLDFISKKICQKPIVTTEFISDKPELLKINISYHCKALEILEVENNVIEKILKIDETICPKD